MLATNGSVGRYDDHTAPHRGATVPQLTLLVVWAAAVVVWVIGRVRRAHLLPTLWYAVAAAATIVQIVQLISPQSLAQEGEVASQNV